MDSANCSPTANVTGLDPALLERVSSLRLAEAADAALTADCADAADAAKLRPMLTLYGRSVGAMDDEVTATYFFAFFRSVAWALHYSIAVYNVAFDLSLDNLKMQLVRQNGYDQLWFVLRAWKPEPGPADPAAREDWVRDVLARFYRDTAKPLVTAFAEAAGTRPAQLWGQLPSLFNYYLHEARCGRGGNLPDYLDTLEADYRLLQTGLDAPETFGLKRNPLDLPLRLIEDIADPAKMQPMKSACCLYYRTEGGEYCYTCPRLKESERETRRAQYRAAAN